MVNRFKSGQSLDGALTAAFLNDLSTMLEQWKRSQTGSIVGATPSTGERSQTVIRVKNTTGDTVPRFAVLGLGDPVIDPSGGDAQLLSFKNTTALQGDTPDIDVHWGKFCITLAPIPDGMIGEAVASGVVTCKINVYHESHQWADIKDGDTTQLDSDDCGTCKILWKESGTGSGKWAVMLVGESQLFGYAVTQEDIAAGDTGDIKFSNSDGTTFGSTLDGTWLASDGTIPEESLVIRIRDNLHHRWLLLPFAASGGNESVEGYLDGDLTAGGTATLSVWEASLGTFADSGVNVTITDRAGWAADSGSYCVATKLGDEYRPIVLGCVAP